MPANAQQPPPAAPSGAARAANKSPAKAAPTKEASNPKSEDSYSLGVSVGSELHQMGIAPAAVSPERILQGMRDALAGKAEMSQAHQQNIRRLLGAVGDANHEKAARFLANNAKKPGVLTTASGLQYQVLNAGSGESPRPSDEVSVNYRGALLDGTEFDSSYKRGGPASFQVNRVIPGWTEALQLMKPGAKFKLFIPPQLAYDLKSRPPIPPGSLLLFDVELLSVKTPPPAPAAQPLATPPAATPAEPKK
ncbi:MAG: FKBP-type peptidyl-prolyl cis-trans isomerase [Steroidobacteraceae bacterium]